MGRRLAERDGELAVLATAVAAARDGSGSTVLVTGEAGIGKSSLVREFTERCRGSARLLTTSCDALRTPRRGGPLRDAAHDTDGPLAAALADDDPDAVHHALVEELALRRPTVLVVEDLHWADDATLDLLLYAARRLDRIGAALVLTYRDDEAAALGQLRRLLGALATCQVRRVPLAPLSPSAVAELVAGTGRDPAAVYAATGGNPFLVSESLAAGPADLPAAVVDAVLARTQRLGEPCRDTLERLSVVPTEVSFDLAAALLDDRIEVLAEAERAGFLEVVPDGVAFRHELARLVIERTLPQLRRRALHLAVVEALRAQPRPDRVRVVRHAMLAGDVHTLVLVGPDAARESAAAGAHRQAVALFESVLPHLDRLAPADRAAVLGDYARELYGALRFRDAVRIGRDAVRRRRELGDRTGQGAALVELSRAQLMTGAVDDAEATARHAVTMLAGGPTARLQLGAVLAATGRGHEASIQLEHAVDAPDETVAGWCRLLIAATRLERSVSGNEWGRALHDAVAAVGGAGAVWLAEALHREGRFGELATCVAEALPVARARGDRVAAHVLGAYRALVRLHAGELDAAEDALRELELSEPGVLTMVVEPLLGVIAARRGDEGAGPVLARLWERAQRQRLSVGLRHAGLAYLEWAWLAGDARVAHQVGDELLSRLGPGLTWTRGDVLEHQVRAGVPVSTASCPEPFASSLRGDHRAAARWWRERGEPYRAAVALGGDGDVGAMAEAVRALDGMGAVAAARRVRDRLRRAGSRVPRGPRGQTRTNPAGLTDRQLTVLKLLRDGLTNVEIAGRLVVSVRTVDHHVAAILRKLGVASRRDAASAASMLGL